MRLSHMKRTILALVALGALAAPQAEAAVIHYTSVLGPEVALATGTGLVDLYLNDVAHTLQVSASFSGLSGNTTVAHIHCCTALPGTGTAAVAVTPGTLPGFPVGVMAGTYAVTLDLTLTGTYTAAFLTASGGTAAGAEAALAANLALGRAYFNVHTSTFPGGEIRGFPKVPEPMTMSLLGLGLGAAAVARRRQARH
jgi:hypothetical protein